MLVTSCFKPDSRKKVLCVKKLCLRDRIFVPIRRSLRNLKKTYIGDHRSSDVWLLHTSEVWFIHLSVALERCDVWLLWFMNQPYLRCLKGTFKHWSSDVRSCIPTNMYNYTLPMFDAVMKRRLELWIFNHDRLRIFNFVFFKFFPDV